VPGPLDRSAGYRTLTEVARRHAGPGVVDLLTGYFAVGSPELLEDLFASAGLRIAAPIEVQLVVAPRRLA